ncbi:hypothetical protein V6V47_17025 [Micromonospora sp. CPCC 205539]|uniref:hypothetical protein n=1 Tax=Micromonospora sp. CPCC 205539 TaxID=3122408 RepID=UPI002FF060FB
MAVDPTSRARIGWAAAAAVLTVAALSACGSAATPSAGSATSNATAPIEPTAGPATSSAAAPPPIKGKLRGYTTVQQLSETADLVVRGEVEAAGFRVDEVLRAAAGSSVPTGSRITLTGLNRRSADMANMSELKAGQVVVLYLAHDTTVANPTTFSTLSADFGVFDVTGSDDAATASTRSQSMAVTGLLTEDPAASGHGFRTTLGQLRAVAAKVK